MRLRAATPADLVTVVGWIDSEAAMVQWSGPTFRWPLTHAQVASRLADPDAQHLVAVDSEDRLLGFVRLSPGEPGAVRVGWVIVDPSRRGEGIGGEFVPAFVERGFDQGAERLSLGVLRHNTAARRLYHRAGFMPTGEVTHPRAGWDCLEMAMTRPDLVAGDAEFSHPRLAAAYDPLDPDRSDLAVYLALAGELGARSVLDIGCGTGTFACLLAGAGLEVTGVDPAGASLDVARGKAGAERVRWVHGQAADALPLQVDLITMTANVAQVFVSDESWEGVLGVARRALKPGGHLVFETRDPARRAWEGWTRARTFWSGEVPGVRAVTTWDELVDVFEQWVTFRWTMEFHDEVLTSTSTLRFRPMDELRSTLQSAGFEVDDVRDAPDRPGAEWVFVARAAG